jgi:hypothetical protein
MSMLRRSPSAAKEIVRGFIARENLPEALKAIAYSVQIANEAASGRRKMPP